MPHLPICVRGCGAIYSSGYLYVIGGVREDNGKMELSKKFYRIGMQSNDVWDQLQDIPKATSWPIVLETTNSIFVFGGEDANQKPTQSTHSYSKRCLRWSAHPDTPVPCDVTRSGGFITGDGCHIVTPLSYLTYLPNKKQWMARHYDTIGDNITPVLWNGRTLCFAWHGNRHTMLVYDENNNEWMHGDISLINCWGTYASFAITL